MPTEPELFGDALDPLARNGKDEMNFAEFPIALLSDRVPKGQKSIKFEDQIYDPKRKRLVTRRRIIDGSEEYGLPTATDDAVILALIQLTKQKTDFASREVEFTRLELLKLLGWTDEGRNFERLKLSLLRIANVTYNYENAWWCNRQKTWTTKAFHIIETVEINDSRGSGRQKNLFPSRVVWNEVVFDSFQAGFLRDIDFRLCLRLEHPISMRMYRFLGKRFHANPEWAFDLKEFAYNYINLGRNYEGGTQIARKLKPAIAELERVGFLEPMTDAERFGKKGREWAIRFVQKRQPPPSLTAANENATVNATDTTGLVQRGVTAATAAELASQHPAPSLQQKIEVFDWLVEQRDKRVAKSPAGFLVKSIQDDYADPKGFVPAAERQRLAEARQARERDAAEARRREREQQAQENAERQAIAAYWAGLTPEQQTALDAAATAEADPEQLALEKGPLKSMGQHIRRNDYIRRILQKRQAEA